MSSPHGIRLNSIKMWLVTPVTLVPVLHQCILQSGYYGRLAVFVDALYLRLTPSFEGMQSTLQHYEC